MCASRDTPDGVPLGGLGRVAGSVAPPGFRRGARVVALGVGAVACFYLGLVLLSATRPLPVVLESSAGQSAGSVEFFDREGQSLGRTLGADGTLSAPARPEDLPPEFVAALLVAEDRRFFLHPGFDPLAITRALWQWLRTGRVVSGGSTLTQQLARTLVPRERSLAGKWQELLLAQRIEMSLDKAAILRAYATHVPFGPNLRGVRAASQAFFDTEPARLSLAELAMLAAMPRGPDRYDPWRFPVRARARRDQILGALAARGLVEPARAREAQKEPLITRRRQPLAEPRHLLRALSQGKLEEWTGGARRVRRVTTTLLASLQGELQAMAREAAVELREHGGSAVAAMVVDNASAEVLAYVGSPEFFDQRALGQNDGCLALRQPGSAIKPFVVAVGLERGGFGPNSLLWDVPTTFSTQDGPFAPKNYDGVHRGPVRLREALGMSLNVPAVEVLARTGIEPTLQALRSFGFSSLTGSAKTYGLALALGDGEVTLAELAQAYATLARRGVFRRLSYVREVVDGTSERRVPPPLTATRVLSEGVAAEVLDILSDDVARAGTFGRRGPLELPFVAATKTGTSTNHRDNWAIGVTNAVTVAVWAGNFDGSPMDSGTSGLVGAVPLMRRILLHAMSTRSEAPLFEPGTLTQVTVCRESGAIPTEACPNTVVERLLPRHRPRESCRLHQRVTIDPENGLVAGPGCSDRRIQSVEVVPETAREWAERAGRPLLPAHDSPRCPVEPGAAASPPGSPLTVLSPEEGSVYAIDPHREMASQRLVFRVAPPAGTRWVRYQVTGEDSGLLPQPFSWVWPLRRGEHELRITTDRTPPEVVRFRVE